MVRRVTAADPDDPDAGEPGKVFRRFESTPYDDDARASPQVTWITSVFPVDDDWAVRQVRLFEVSCRKDGAHILLSAPLAVDRLLTGPPNGLPALADRLRAEAGPVCIQDRAGARDQPLAGIEPVARTTYTFGAPRGAGVFAAGASASGKIDRNLIVLSARQLTQGREIADAPFRDRVVVIGSTHGYARDTYRTPLGAMPGAFILANAAASAPDILRSTGWSGFLGFSLSFALYVGFALLARVFRGVVTTIIVGLACLLTVVVLSWLTLPVIAIDIAALSLGMLTFHLFVVAVARLVEDIFGANGWRAILENRAK